MFYAMGAIILSDMSEQRFHSTEDNSSIISPNDFLFLLMMPGRPERPTTNDQ
uniref:Uncharacterized protein n=1 Tax=Glossina palpalis gambiensis TaxID=67801 RepID=A0A1B0AXL5_9MUSC